MNRTLKPILCKHLATLRAAVFADSLLHKNRHKQYTATAMSATFSFYLTDLIYEGRSINKLQNSVILLVFQI